MQKIKRFYYNGEFTDYLRIEGNVYNHIKNVLRCNVGERILLANERNFGIYELENFDKKCISGKLQEILPHKVPDYEIIIYISVIKNRYMDYMLEKLSEIGVTKIIPVYTANSTASVTAKTFNRYKEHVYSGALQAEHNFLPSLCPVVHIEDVAARSAQNFLLSARGENRGVPKLYERSVSLFLGPEGGLTEKETALLEEKGFETITPIQSILKAETAAIVFSGMFKILMENL